MPSQRVLFISPIFPLSHFLFYFSDIKAILRLKGFALSNDVSVFLTMTKNVFPYLGLNKGSAAVKWPYHSQKQYFKASIGRREAQIGSSLQTKEAERGRRLVLFLGMSGSRHWEKASICLPMALQKYNS